jgi:hypothetical protein
MNNFGRGLHSLVGAGAKTGLAVIFHRAQASKLVNQMGTFLGLLGLISPLILQGA